MYLTFHSTQQNQQSSPHLHLDVASYATENSNIRLNSNNKDIVDSP